jgi:hypothetical protein
MPTHAQGSSQRAIVSAPSALERLRLERMSIGLPWDVSLSLMPSNEPFRARLKLVLCAAIVSPFWAVPVTVGLGSHALLTREWVSSAALGGCAVALSIRRTFSPSAALGWACAAGSVYAFVVYAPVVGRMPLDDFYSYPARCGDRISLGPLLVISVLFGVPCGAVFGAMFALGVRHARAALDRPALDLGGRTWLSASRIVSVAALGRYAGTALARSSWVPSVECAALAALAAACLGLACLDRTRRARLIERLRRGTDGMFELVPMSEQEERVPALRESDLDATTRLAIVRRDARACREVPVPLAFIGAAPE